ncbi:uncharacterized protein [Spinacia oleracea]|uniref:Uncharacterized protein n=1 Tax=Spinacia oleracea TaxID=3562 RepID=A0A9R0I5Y6_SPIOL|nr:uncharacterized protein LOC110783252 [Spinacia oleracea]
MASVQQAHDSNQLSDKEKTAIGEATKEAESFILAKNNHAKAAAAAAAATVSQGDKVVFVTGVLKNLFSKAMYQWKTYIWDGESEFMDRPPYQMNPSGIYMFVHMSLPQSHSKGAIIYDAPKGTDPALGWLFAWDKSNEVNKVYVEAGAMSRIKRIQEREILEKLVASKNTSRYWDSDTGASAAAEIKKWDNSMSLLVVTFDQDK